MWRWIGWAAKLAASAILLSFLCIWTTGYIVNSYLQTVVKQLDIPLEVEPFALSGVWGTLWGADHSPKESDEASSSATPPSSSPSQTADLSSGTESAGTTTPQPDNLLGGEVSSTEPDNTPDVDAPSQEPSEEVGAGDETTGGAGGATPSDGEAIPVWNSNNGTGGSLGSAMTSEDRQRLYSLVVSKLTSEQLQQLSSYLEGGVDAQELPKVQELLKGALSEQEYEQMMTIIQGESTSVED